MRESVNLTKIKTKKANGQVYEYWVLRWFGTNGKQRSQSLGRVDKLSKRQAEKLRRQKQNELEQNPGRRNVATSPTLGEFLSTYFENRKSELAPGTLELHQQTARYLKGYLGDCRRLNNVHRADARAFKAALAAGKLAYLNKRKCKLAEATVNMHIRNARRMFGMALEDDLIPFNPFDKLAGRPPAPKGWHEVTPDEFSKLMEAANPAWRLLLGLTRYAGLRRGEALSLRWDCIQWDKSRLEIVANDEWTPKDRDSRIVPICPELHALLLEAFEAAEDGQMLVILAGAIVVKNTSRDFTVLCKRAGVTRYRKPLHTLRKTCLTDWARRFPAHVVAAWAGHANIETTSQFYLQVSEAEYERAAGIQQPAESHPAGL